MALNVFIGYDSSLPDISEVCAFSMRRRSSIALAIHFLKLQELVDSGLYWRETDPKASTEFTYLRFLVPHLCRYEGMALFCDNDFLWLDDVANLLAEGAGDHALHCVQHDHHPPEKYKMDGKVQTRFPRKNWSSLMLFDCGHEANRALDPDRVSTASPAFLHRMQWLNDDQIGSLSRRWNWLEGWYSGRPKSPPGAVHYTRGGPWFDAWKGCDFAELWLEEHREWSHQNTEPLATISGHHS
jgi:hypothetical protein